MSNKIQLLRISAIALAVSLISPGAGAQALKADADAMLDKLIAEKWLTANAVFGLFPANTMNSDDIEIYTDETRTQVAFTWYGLRQQTEKPVIDGVPRPNQCLADFIAPRGTDDYIGLFAVTAGLGMDDWAPFL